jgi:hypothetical protein
VRCIRFIEVTQGKVKGAGRDAGGTGAGGTGSELGAIRDAEETYLRVVG